MFSIDVLPARHGDSLWIEYEHGKRTRRLLIDGGVLATYSELRERILAIPATRRHFDLLVITHMDADHIEGALKLLHDESLKVTYGDIWFNGWRHLPREPEDQLGAVAAEFVSAVISQRALPWNQLFDGREVALHKPEVLESVELEGKLRLTLLSPTTQQLSKLRPKWRREVRRAGMTPGSTAQAARALAKKKKFAPPPDELGSNEVQLVKKWSKSNFAADRAVANGSSIAFLLEFAGIKAVFAGDAHADVLRASIEILAEKSGRRPYPVDVFKLSHHGSQRNNSAALLSLAPAKHYLVSTDGSIFDHPDPPAMARVVTLGTELRPVLHFNYSSIQNRIWKSKKLMREFHYTAIYPTHEPGSKLRLL
jgi:beta-lactamase superfamily II metal-dependent hydrolase